MSNYNRNGSRKQSSSLPKIKILSQQVYKTDRIDDRERQELHNKYGQESLLLIFNSNSCRRLKEYIEWGYQSRKNHVEQGGILLGHVKQYQREIFSFVDDCILANTKGNSSFVEITADMWSAMQQELDGLNAQRSEHEQLAIIGWFHTHPNGLLVFMSGTDQDTQDKNFSQDWQVSVVLNPQKMKLRAFFGKEIREGRIVDWDNRQLQRVKERHEEMTLPKPEITRDPVIAAEIASYQEKISENEQKIADLKKNTLRLVLGGLLLVSVFFVVWLCVGNLLNKISMPVETSEPPTTLTPDTKVPVSKKTSVLMFSVVSEKWTSYNDSLYCDVAVTGKTTEGAPYNSIHRIKCNSDESFIELEAGTYTITFNNLPQLAGELVFNDVVPVNLTVDGKNPKLISIELETKAVTTLEPTSETEVIETPITTSQPESAPSLTPSASE